MYFPTWEDASRRLRYVPECLTVGASSFILMCEVHRSRFFAHGEKKMNLCH